MLGQPDLSIPKEAAPKLTVTSSIPTVFSKSRRAFLKSPCLAFRLPLACVSQSLSNSPELSLLRARDWVCKNAGFSTRPAGAAKPTRSDHPRPTPTARRAATSHARALPAARHSHSQRAASGGTGTRSQSSVAAGEPRLPGRAGGERRQRRRRLRSARLGLRAGKAQGGGQPFAPRRPPGRCPGAGGRHGAACPVEISARRPGRVRLRLARWLSGTQDRTATLPRARLAEITIQEHAGRTRGPASRAYTKGTVAISPGNHRSLPGLIRTSSCLNGLISHWRCPVPLSTREHWRPKFSPSHTLPTPGASRRTLLDKLLWN